MAKLLDRVKFTVGRKGEGVANKGTCKLASGLH